MNEEYINIGLTIAAIVALIYLSAILVRFFSQRNNRIVKSLVKKFPGGFKLIYSDQKESDRAEYVVYSKLLYSENLELTGKPDYIYSDKKGFLYPVEIKSGKIGESDEPHKGDLLQLAAYFVLAEENFSEKAKFGRIIYSDYMFTIKNTKKLNRMLKTTLRDMRNMLKYGEDEPAANFATCRYCICNGTVCEYCD